MSKDELLELAKPVFDKYGVNKVYGTSDGNIFLMSNRAELHAGTNQTVYTLNKPADKGEKEEKVYTGLTAQMTVNEIKEGLLEVDDLDVLETWLNSEVGELNRKGAVAAINARMDELVSAN